MRPEPAETLVAAFFAGILITLAAGLGSSLFLSYDLQGFASDEVPSAPSRAIHLAGLVGIAILVAGCVGAALLLAGWARRPLGLLRFAAATLGLTPLPAIVLPAVAIGAGIALVLGSGLGLAAAVVVYGVLTTGYAYGWARLVGRWAARHAQAAADPGRS